MTNGILEDDSRQSRDFEDFEIEAPHQGRRLGKLRLHLAQALPVPPAGAGRPRYIIRRLRQTHCKRGPEVCEKCRETDREDFCLQDTQPPDPGMVQRRLIHVKSDGEDFWPEFEVERVFADKAETEQYATDRGIADVSWNEKEKENGP